MNDIIVSDEDYLDMLPTIIIVKIICKMHEKIKFW